MKVKTIKQILRAKMDEWLESITNEGVRDLAAKNSFITGGSIVSMLMGEEVNDYDTYFRDFQTCLAVVNYYAAQIPEVSVKSDNGRISIRVNRTNAYEGDEEASDESKESETPEYKPVFMSSNAITLTDKIQLVCRFYGEPAAVHQSYDFVHCTCYWTSWDNELVTNQEALLSMMSRELRYMGSKYPLCSLIRIRKFIQRKWTINAGQILKMVMQLQELDLSDPKVLEDQLVGVDSAYFHHLLEILSKNDPEKINTTYLMTIIDKIF